MTCLNQVLMILAWVALVALMDLVTVVIVTQQKATLKTITIINLFLVFRRQLLPATAILIIQNKETR